MRRSPMRTHLLLLICLATWLHPLRGRANDRPEVLVYAGAGTSTAMVGHALGALREALGAHYTIRPVTAEELLGSPWEARAALLVMPGGRDVPYLTRLGASGAA